MVLYKIIHFNFIEGYTNPLTTEKIKPIIRIHIIKTDNSNAKTIVCRNIEYLPLVLFISGHGKFSEKEPISKDDINSLCARLKSEKSVFGRKILTNCNRVIKEIETLFPQLTVTIAQTGLIIEAISRSIEESIKHKRFHSRDYGSIVVLRLKTKRPDIENISKVINLLVIPLILYFNGNMYLTHYIYIKNYIP